MVYNLLSTLGLSIVLMSAEPVERTIAEALRVPPTLARSTHYRNGIMRLDADPATFWTAVEGPRGSAVVVFVSASSDSRRATEPIAMLFQRPSSSSEPFVSDRVCQGKVSPAGAAILQECDVVPVWEFQHCAHLVPVDGFPVTPITLRRAAAGWNRIGADLYQTSVDTGPDESAAIYLVHDNAATRIMTPVALDGQVPDWVHPLARQEGYGLDANDETIGLLSPAPYPVDAAGLGQAALALAQELVSAFRRW